MSPPPLIYLSGPYLGCTETEALGWRREAAILLGEGHCLCPRWVRESTADWGEQAVRDLVLRDLADIERSTALIACCWKPGWGTAQEIVYAHLAHKPVVVVAWGEVSPWLRYHSDYLTPSLEDGCRWIKSHLGLGSG